MSDVTVELEWEGEGLQFAGGALGAPPTRVDGNGKTATSPVQALLVSLAGCTAADVVDILQKMRVPLAGLRVRIEGDRAPEAPRRYTAIRMVYEVTGLSGDGEDKLRRAIQLSHEKYCSVMHSLRTDIQFSTQVVLR
jgi:putative redox protein